MCAFRGKCKQIAFLWMVCIGLNWIDLRLLVRLFVYDELNWIQELNPLLISSLLDLLCWCCNLLSFGQQQSVFMLTKPITTATTTMVSIVSFLDSMTDATRQKYNYICCRCLQGQIFQWKQLHQQQQQQFKFTATSQLANKLNLLSRVTIQWMTIHRLTIQLSIKQKQILQLLTDVCKQQKHCLLMIQ